MLLVVVTHVPGQLKRRMICLCPSNRPVQTIDQSGSAPLSHMAYHLVDALEITSPRLFPSLFALWMPPTLHHTFEIAHVGWLFSVPFSKPEAGRQPRLDGARYSVIIRHLNQVTSIRGVAAGLSLSRCLPSLLGSSSNMDVVARNRHFAEA